MGTSVMTPRRLHTSLVTFHSYEASFCLLSPCLLNYSTLGFFSLSNRAIILCWLVHLLG